MGTSRLLSRIADLLRPELKGEWGQPTRRGFFRLRRQRKTARRDRRSIRREIPTLKIKRASTQLGPLIISFHPPRVKGVAIAYRLMGGRSTV